MQTSGFHHPGGINLIYMMRYNLEFGLRYAQANFFFNMENIFSNNNR